MSFYDKYGYVLSQTSLKDLEKEETCPLRWKGQWLEKVFKFEPNLAMTQGLYFEQQVIGASATDDRYDMPLNKDGSKKVAHTRIDEQAEYCKKVLFDKDFDDYIGNVIGCEVDWVSFQHVVELDNKRIVIDALGTCEEGWVINDLKLTADVDNVFGGYTWGKVSNMDLFQQGFYQMVFEQTTKVPVVKNVLTVFDHSPRKGKKIFDLTLSEGARITIMDRIDNFEKAVDHYEKSGWVTYPSEDECQKCPLDCPFRRTESKLVVESAEI